ncbi:uncharacterized protein ACA1_143980 [Acanthamoeba castellanii str. Neff]|uniref:Uncharacterized protein n=1 Tax=Acanthamoeba castellanii (strain ATCC 30010 / Neff) TaxID=1257118 RepID=L8HH39_ACACF|nr:uncharacterized protein ACA1_143980 [Acanthamoeba castellanii str. Neff]ELR24008.1 hypothetical protein ACA1_143980 [Acanthamoeba castellanii str. Neff]
MPKQAASNHRGTQLTIDGEAHTLGVDLFTAARAYLRFSAFPRYAKFLRLAALYPERRLHALPDVELLWKTHLIRPIHYRKEMELLFGRVVDHAELSAAAETAAALSPSVLAETERLWELHYAEPYALDRTEEAASPADGGADSAEVLTRLPGGGEAPSWEAVAAGISVKPDEVEKDARWLPFLRTFVAKDKTEELCNDECTLKRCVEGYARFIADCKQAFRNGQPLHQTDRGEEGPTYDIDFMWHAHMMHPVAYRRDCQALGVNLDHLPWPHHH